MHKAWTQRIWKNYKEWKVCIKTTMEWLEVKPHARDRSKKVVAKDSTRWLSKLSRSSNVRRLRSLRNVHVKHNGPKFQTSVKCFPNQFLHPNKRPTTFLGTTQSIPKEPKTKFHSPTTIEQCSNRLSTVSPLHWHIQHHPTEYALSS